MKAVLRAWPLAAALLAGCSALQIDVDVYKGPLANEAETQLRQFAALAMAAKPLLASLRNDIEDGTRKAHESASLYSLVSDERLQSHLGQGVGFESRLARFLNNVLLNYETVDDAPVAEMRRAHDDIRAAIDAVRTTAGDRGLAWRIRGGPSGDSAFAKAYANWLCGDGTPACIGQRREPPRMLFTSADRGGACVATRDRECATSQRSSEAYHLLAKPRQASAHARELLGSDDPALRRRIDDLARAYLEGRDAARRMLDASLLALERDTAHAASYAATAAYMVQPAVLACVLNDKRQPPAQLAAAAETLQQLQAVPPGEHWLDSARQQLARRVAEQPLAMAELLRAAHTRAAEIGNTPGARLQPPARSGLQCPTDWLAKADVQRAEFAVGLEFGIARGLSRDEGNIGDALDRIESTLLKALPANGSAFDRARLPEGIEHLTREFLRRSEQRHHDLEDPEVRESVARLEAALLFFAERVLFIANNLTYTTLAAELKGFDKQALAELSPRLALLQTLGNTLVLHANDLRRRTKHAGQQRDAGDTELRAAAQAWQPGAERAFDDIVTFVQGELTRRVDERVAAERNALRREAVGDALATNHVQAKDRAEKADLAREQAKGRWNALDAVVRTVATRRQITDAGQGGLFPLPDASGANTRGLEAFDSDAVQSYLKDLADVKPDEQGAVALVDGIGKVIEKFGAVGSQAPARRERLAAVRDWLASYRDAFLVLPQRADTATVAAAVRRLVFELARQARDEFDGTVRDAKIAATERDTLKAQLDKRARANKAVPTTPMQPVQPPPDAKTLAEVVEQLRRTVVAEALKRDLRDAKGVFDVLREELAKLAQGGNAAAAEAGKQLKSLDPPAALTFHLPPRTDALQARQVFDQVIASLRQRRIQALAAGNTQQARNLQEAIDAAYETRAGSTFLRPASDYLRSVYSATNVAGKVESEYPNLLDDYLRLNWNPLLESLQSRFNRQSREAKEQVELLYWQNINRVTLAGGGDTNFVLAKDDVGNWYVKSYAADPEKVIRSAQSLLLFNAGQRFDANLLRRVELQRRVDNPDTANAARDRAQAELDRQGPDANIGLDRVRERYAERYADALDIAAGAFAQSLAALPQALQRDLPAQPDLAAVAPDRLQAAISASQGQLDGAARQLRAALDLPRRDITRRERLETAYVEGLQAVRRFALQTGAALQTDTAVAAAPTAAKAAGYVKQESTRRLVDAADSLKKAIAAFDDGLAVLGEAQAGR